jgi:hypothetical protein
MDGLQIAARSPVPLKSDTIFEDTFDEGVQERFSKGCAMERRLCDLQVGSTGQEGDTVDGAVGRADYDMHSPLPPVCLRGQPLVF